ncbi:MAG: response regulator [Epsilonproteobacteria bacterium]|nr:response regulator [Campylobacterota bacterium]
MEQIRAIAIDDSKTILYLERNYLKEVGIEAKIFEEPLDAIKYVMDHGKEVDLVFVDYVMPSMDGLSVIERIKPFTDAIIVMVTSIGKEELKLKALEHGAVEFINKPIVKAEFLATVRNLAKIITQQKLLADEKLLVEAEVRKQVETIKKQEREILEVLAYVAKYRDEGTFLHVKRVAKYSSILARAHGLSIDEVCMISQAAPLHDIGKIGIRDDILFKNGKLSDEEFEIMKSHTVIGYNILKSSSAPMLQIGADIALTHHERWDGLGYPNGLVGESIPIYGRIVAIADVFDALTAKRPYKKAWDLEDAMQFLEENKGSMFDPTLVEEFKGVQDEVFAYYELSGKHETFDCRG